MPLQPLDPRRIQVTPTFYPMFIIRSRDSSHHTNRPFGDRIIEPLRSRDLHRLKGGAMPSCLTGRLGQCKEAFKILHH
jgi:hypothetical protein